MNQEAEVRYHLLRPEQVVARRKECPVVYIPIGNLEWHGLHNPLGADTLQAEGQAVYCARKGGGLVFPALYFGENRLQGLMEANARDRREIAAAMELPPENFQPETFPYDAVRQAEQYQRLLIHVLAEADTLGFEVGVLVAGHYPLIDHARSAVLQWNQGKRVRRAGGMLAWAFVDYLLIRDRYDFAGDHAGGWETSRVMALHPEAVDTSKLPPKGGKLVGVGGRMAPQDASAEFGRETLEAAAEVAVGEVRHRLENRGVYAAHGGSLREGLWRQGAG
jgi:creatinine amidohydrolase